MEQQVTETLFFFAVLIFSVIIHEVSHGAVALKLGDPTAKHAGRLTLNPLPHIDPIGSIFLPLLLLASGARVLFGWARPVPINPLNFRNPKIGSLWTALAGPASNLFVAAVFALFVRLIFAYAPFLNPIIPFLKIVVMLNIVLGIFNLVPIPPLDGSKILFVLIPFSEETLIQFERYGLLLLILFLLFFLPFVFRIALLIFYTLVGAPAL